MFKNTKIKTHDNIEEIDRRTAKDPFDRPRDLAQRKAEFVIPIKCAGSKPLKLDRAETGTGG
jgi:hypothetical protein